MYSIPPHNYALALKYFNLEDDVGSGNIWDPFSNDYCEFEMYVEKLPQTAQDIEYHHCHICAKDVPSMFLPQHESGVMHQLHLKVVDIMMERMKNHENQSPGRRQTAPANWHYCITCNTCSPVLEVVVHGSSAVHLAAEARAARVRGALHTLTEPPGFAHVATQVNGPELEQVNSKPASDIKINSKKVKAPYDNSKLKLVPNPNVVSNATGNPKGSNPKGAKPTAASNASENSKPKIVSNTKENANPMAVPKPTGVKPKGNKINRKVRCNKICQLCYKMANTLDIWESHMNSKYHKANVQIFEQSVMHDGYCDVCQIWIPGDANNIESHLQSPNHKDNLANGEIKPEISVSNPTEENKEVVMETKVFYNKKMSNIKYTWDNSDKNAKVSCKANETTPKLNESVKYTGETKYNNKNILFPNFDVEEKSVVVMQHNDVDNKPDTDNIKDDEKTIANYNKEEKIIVETDNINIEKLSDEENRHDDVKSISIFNEERGIEAKNNDDEKETANENKNDETFKDVREHKKNLNHIQNFIKEEKITIETANINIEKTSELKNRKDDIRSINNINIFFPNFNVEEKSVVVMQNSDVDNKPDMDNIKHDVKTISNYNKEEKIIVETDNINIEKLSDEENRHDDVKSISIFNEERSIEAKNNDDEKEIANENKNDGTFKDVRGHKKNLNHIQNFIKEEKITIETANINIEKTSELKNRKDDIRSINNINIFFPKNNNKNIFFPNFYVEEKRVVVTQNSDVDNTPDMDNIKDDVKTISNYNKEENIIVETDNINIEKLSNEENRNDDVKSISIFNEGKGIETKNNDDEKETANENQNDGRFKDVSGHKNYLNHIPNFMKEEKITIETANINIEKTSELKNRKNDISSIPTNEEKMKTTPNDIEKKCEENKGIMARGVFLMKKKQALNKRKTMLKKKTENVYTNDGTNQMATFSEAETGKEANINDIPNIDNTENITVESIAFKDKHRNDVNIKFKRLKKRKNCDML